MTCSRCRTHFCYNCNAKITPHLLNDHFINDASCSTVDNFRLNEERAIKAGQEARKKYLELHPDAKVNVEELNMKGLVERKGI